MAERRIFAVGVDRIVYVPDEEAWYLNGSKEGQTSRALASDLLWMLSSAKYEMHGEQPEHDESWPNGGHDGG